MGFQKQFKNLCGASMFYFVISMIALILCIMQNIGNKNHCNIGHITIKGNIFIMILFKIIFILFWTWILSLICRAGYKGLSWFLVLFPFILMFAIALLISNNRNLY